MSLHLVSLFAGVGGIDFAAERAGIPTVAAVEIDQAARGVLAHRFPSAALFPDVREVTADDLRAAGAVPDRTVLAGGFPCQDLSVAGRRAGMDRGSGTRSALFWEIDRLLASFAPRWVVLENVPGLLSSRGGRDMGAVLGSLGRRGYGYAWRVVDSQFFGVPQRRRRVVIVGRLGDGAGPVEVLLEPEGGGGNPAAGAAEGPVAAGAVAGGAGEPFVYGAGRSLTAHGQRLDVDSETFVVSALQGGGQRGHRVDAEGAAGGHLVPYVKAKRAQTDQDDETWRAEGPAPTLNAMDNTGESRATVLAVDAYSLAASDAVTHTLRRGNGNEQTLPCVVAPIIGFSHTAGIDAQPNESTFPPPMAGHDRMPAVLAPTLSASNNPSRSPQSAEITAQVEAVHAHASTVRRLTPVECERLQGFPDGWTAQRVEQSGKRAGQVVDQPDSARYRQMGNAVTVDVFAWVMRRLAAVDAGGAS